MSKPLNVLQFFEMFPDNEACLDHLMKVRHGNPLECPKCGKEGRFHKRKNRPIYECQWCSHHISPMAGTPFERSRTPLVKWFYAMYLFTTSRHGVPAKELQRQLSVTYKTAWRMGHQIRKYMAIVDGDDNYGGHVELDETFVGGYKKGQQGGKGKAVVFGMLERNGSLQTYHVPDRKSKTLKPIIKDKIVKGAIISTDEYGAYKDLNKHGYIHGHVCHEAKEYVKGIHHTNNLESFWARLKNSIRGTHVHVSAKYLPLYLGEFEYRYNMRKSPSWMFDRLLGAF